MRYKITLCLTFLLLVAAGTAHAATGGGGLPWEAPLTTFSNSITGPVAYAISLVGIVGAGSALIFMGGHMNEFFRVILLIVLGIAFIIAAKNTLTDFGFTAGATIAHVEAVHSNHVQGAHKVYSWR